MEKIFGCDLNEIFGNYGFAGNGIVLGGKYGDDKKQISICNDKTLEAVQEYLSIVDYFHLNMDSSYEECRDKFAQGSMLATVLYTDDLTSMSDWQINYKIAEIPDYNETVPVRPLSSTKALVVNQYSKNQQAASDFADSGRQTGVDAPSPPPSAGLRSAFPRTCPHQ